MLQLEQIDKKFSIGKEDREEKKSEVRYNKNDNLDNYILARAAEEKLQKMAERVETTDKEREKFIKKDKGDKTKTVRNRKRQALESGDDNGHNEQRPTREFLCHTVKLDALLRNSFNQDKAV